MSWLEILALDFIDSFRFFKVVQNSYFSQLRVLGSLVAFHLKCKDRTFVLIECMLLTACVIAWKHQADRFVDYTLWVGFIAPVDDTGPLSS